MREMKDSGVAWIGEIPEEWVCCKQKYAMKLINGRAYSDSEFEKDGKYKILRVGNLFSNPVWYTSNLELPENKYCSSGDLLYSWSMSYAPVFWYGEKVIYHYHIWKVNLNDKIQKKFAYYYLVALTDALKAEIHETTMGFITMGVMNNSYIAIPNIAEQQTIATYLDQKCTQIDALITNQQKQIERLKAYKQSLITETVTKGLNPDVPMKDSGVEWIGKIPEGWEIAATKYLFNIETGATPKSDNHSFFDGEVVWVTPADFKTDDIFVSFGKKNLTIEGLNSCSATLVPKGSLIFSKRAPIGSVVISSVELCTNQGCLSCIPYTSNLTKYYYYVMSICTEQYNLLGSGTTFKEISASNFMNFSLPLPTISEQQAIVSYLDQKCTQIDNLIAIKQKKIEKLQQYKKSLIYEYVTGKKEI